MAPPEVLQLVERFHRNRHAYKDPAYNEAQLRQEFLNPLFKALGWDVDNDKGHAPAYHFHRETRTAMLAISPPTRYYIFAG